MTSNSTKQWADGPFELVVTPRHANNSVHSYPTSSLALANQRVSLSLGPKHRRQIRKGRK